MANQQFYTINKNIVKQYIRCLKNLLIEKMLSKKTDETGDKIRPLTLIHRKQNKYPIMDLGTEYK
jgi:hypothetical protein